MIRDPRNEQHQPAGHLSEEGEFSVELQVHGCDVKHLRHGGGRVAVDANAPVVHVRVLNLAYLIVGVVIVEVVFVYPGLGQLLVDAVQRRDMPVVQACCLIFAAAYTLLNLIADVLSILSNPRLLHPK